MVSMKRILILFSLLLVLSCGEKKNKDNTEQKKDAAATENINNGNEITDDKNLIHPLMVDCQIFKY